MKRRDIIKSVLLGTGAAISGNTVAQSHTSVSTSSTNVSSAESSRALLFDTHQRETVAILSDLIIPATDTPGAKEADVAAYIDLILNDGDDEPRESFLSGLGWLDGYALRTHGNPFVRLTTDQQIALLESLDNPTRSDLGPGVRFFEQIKQLTIEGYYTSKIGIDELNKYGVPNSYA
jgi:gluconate 2-dehydrogenase gamma chain